MKMATKRKSTGGFLQSCLTFTIFVVAFCFGETRVWGFENQPRPASSENAFVSGSFIGENGIAFTYDVLGCSVAAKTAATDSNEKTEKR